MKICVKTGNGVCLSCKSWMSYDGKYMCKHKAEELLDCLAAIIDTDWTQEQEWIFADFEITKDNTE